MRRSRMGTLTVLLALALGLFGAGASFAAPKTIALDVPGMTCELCPLTVRKALQKVEGVEKVAVSYGKKEAVVTFDDAKTSVEALMNATGQAGYPSTLKPAPAGK
jgi:mercuric ion binding protein